MKSIRINFPCLLAVLAVTAALLAAAFYRMEIDADVTKYLPRHDPVIADAEHVLKNPSVQDRLVIDIGIQKEDPAVLLACGRFVEQKLRESGLFEQVGFKQYAKIMPDLLSHILNNLPILFDRTQLQEEVAPLLTTENVNRTIRNDHNKLLDLEGIGRAASISKDPLAISNKVLARLSSLSPSKNVRFLGGQLISSDGKHLLLIATPSGSGMDTQLARQLSALFQTIGRELSHQYGDNENPVALTPMGAYRVALDNEVIAREDSEKAIFLASLGIALLLIFAFPRPLLGLFAFLPAIFGSAAALFVLALLEPSLSIMALGFGGAVIAITVDHGIAFLLFLDRPEITTGKMAAREIRSVGLLTALTTMGAFGALLFSDFPIFEQLGLFSAMGIGFSFLFVHLVFPMVFPEMPSAPPRTLPLRKGVEKLTGFGKKGIFFMALLGVFMIFFARPEFLVSLNAMNTVSQKTLAAEKTFNRVWGEGIFENIFLMTAGEHVSDLQATGDKLLPMLNHDLASGVLTTGFIPTMVFPGGKRAMENLSAWRSFWSKERIDRLKEDLENASAETGFRRDAFAPFLETLTKYNDQADATKIPAQFHDMLGIKQNPAKTLWVQFSNLKPGPAYDAQAFYARYGSLGKIFDPTFFSQRLGGLLFSTFLRMLWIIALSIIILLFIYFLDWHLVLAALIPVLFALVCTLGTLNLLGHPLDIPGLMLSIVVLGMGIDYSLFMVRAYQRYGVQDHPSFQLIKMTIFMAAFSTIIGFGVLCFSRHALLISAGLTSLLGITYSLAGAFVILPPILKFLFRTPAERTGKPLSLFRAVLRRYRHMEAYPRCFARVKMMTDPMFKALPRFFSGDVNPWIILDIGTGYGVPACWLLERFPKAMVYGIDPDGERVRVASKAMGKRGGVKQDAAPNIPNAPDPADMAMMLDMAHYLSDEAFSLTLRRLYKHLKERGCLLIRVAVPSDGQHSWLWKLEAFKLRFSHVELHDRSIENISRLIEETGFKIKESVPSGKKGESVWLMAEKD
ncbi:methyltransferase domain protein [delta proteobacterium NaphS2]|nr:methyltransferase domain protein [delta proteobacterium NaphS2]